MTLERHFGSFYDSLNRSLTIIVILTLSDPFWPSLTQLKQIYTHFQFFLSILNVLKHPDAFIKFTDKLDTRL